MQIRVLFFGILKDLAGRNSEVLTLPDFATANDVLEHYRQKISSIESALPSIAISINQEYSRPDAVLKSGDEIALLPPVSGGAPRCKITPESIDTNVLLAEMKQPEDGAALVFEGIVR